MRCEVFLPLDLSKPVHEEVNLNRRFTQPDDYPFSMPENVSHFRNLVAPLSFITLIDADGIYPEYPVSVV